MKMTRITAMVAFTGDLDSRAPRPQRSCCRAVSRGLLGHHDAGEVSSTAGCSRRRFHEDHENRQRRRN